MEVYMLKGNIYITDNIEVIRNSNLSLIKVIVMDEEFEDNYVKGMIPGTILLPPIEAKIAEVDGDEQKYDYIYSSYLLKQDVERYISAIIAFLYKGGSLMLYINDMEYTNTKNKFVQLFYKLYGIHAGIVESQNPQEANCYYDDRCFPMWMNLIFLADVIYPDEYLYKYPIDASIPDNIMNKLMDIIMPLGDTINDRIKFIENHRARIKAVPQLEIPIRRIE